MPHAATPTMIFTPTSAGAPFTVVSPIHTLPVEILSEIFDLTIKDETHIHDAHRISHICSYWRRVAHSTPRLWTRTLEVHLCEKRNVADGLKTWLERSAPLPVSLVFTPIRDINLPILEEALRVAPRCRSLQFDPNSTMPPWLTRRLAQCSLDHLEALDLGRVHARGEEHSSSSFTAPRLRKLSMVHLGALQIVVPWAQLTELNLGCGSLDVIFEVLGQCANLTEASIRIYGWSQFHAVGNDIAVRFSQLHTLSLYFWTGIASCVFVHLSTPALEKLHLRLNRVDWILADFTAFLLRAPNLAFLQFSFANSLASDDLAAVIHHASSLTHLTIDKCGNCFDDAFIRTLHYADSAEPRAPCLHSLVVRSVEGNFTEEVLADMIASRWWTDTELASVSPAVARWTHVELQFGIGSHQHRLGPRFTDIVKDIPSDILIYSKGI
ncbi:Cytochrome P450 [Mycena sanguinolenta]|uniref:Cytochrome P450 n=1 Tax=Mycena sanguinolenta TaxID=230812 RepID=A0A8H6YAL5_9AGAR|nr:Cytochrome P450 [Mycena sanguinolenta]